MHSCENTHNFAAVYKPTPLPTRLARILFPALHFVAKFHPYTARLVHHVQQRHRRVVVLVLRLPALIQSDEQTRAGFGKRRVDLAHVGVERDDASIDEL